MCGIAGYWRPSGAPHPLPLDALAVRMGDTLTHRGPDDTGRWVSEEHGVLLAHRRLSVVELSPLGHQPMASRSGRFLVVFNGEIYNFRQLRAELEAAGACFRGGSDTEVLLAAVEAWGIAGSLGRFNGMFALALWDNRARELTLARDRFGEKPLFYSCIGGAVMFASELKALRAIPGLPKEVDRDSLVAYTRHGYIPSGRSVFVGVRKLPAGSYATFRRCRTNGGASLEEAPPERYWQLRDVASSGIAEANHVELRQAASDVERALRDAVALRMVADVPVGAFLSGGIDSSLIVSLMQESCSRPVQTFTIGFDEAEYDEAASAREVARWLGTDHTELYLSPSDAMRIIPTLPSVYDEPFADSSQLPTMLLCRLAREHVTVALSGDGGDELFGGYDRYVWTTNAWRALARVPSPLRRLTGAALGHLAKPIARAAGVLPRGLTGRVLPSASRIRRLAQVTAARDREDAYLRVVSGVVDPTRFVIGGREPVTALTDTSAWLASGGLSEHMMYVDAVTYLTDDILVKLDRAAMAVSLETRVPMLDPAVVALAWSLPSGLKRAGALGKAVLREILYKRVPRHLVERPKTGFGVPVGEWLRTSLRPWADDLLAPATLRRQGFFDAHAVTRCWREHRGGEANWATLLWTVLMFQAWYSEVDSG